MRLYDFLCLVGIYRTEKWSTSEWSAPTLQVRHEGIRWYLVDDMRGPVELPEVIPAIWLSNCKILIEREKPEASP